MYCSYCVVVIVVVVVVVILVNRSEREEKASWHDIPLSARTSRDPAYGYHDISDLGDRSSNYSMVGSRGVDDVQGGWNREYSKLDPFGRMPGDARVTTPDYTRDRMKVGQINSNSAHYNDYMARKIAITTTPVMFGLRSIVSHRFYYLILEVNGYPTCHDDSTQPLVTKPKSNKNRKHRNRHTMIYTRTHTHTYIHTRVCV